MPSPVRVAVVGAGSMAREHIRAFQSLADVEVVGIHSRTRSKAQALADEFRIGTVCDSTAELYESLRADLVLVLVFETSMRAVATECVKYPWAIFLEKPPGMHLADAQAIDAAAAAAGRKIIVGLNRRFLSSSQAAAEDLAAHGDTRFIHVQDQQDLSVARSLNHPAEVVDNWMFANSIHLVDYLRFFGRGKITAVAPIKRWDPRKPGIVLSRIDFESGDIGLYEGIWNGPGPWAITVTTEKKRWEMRPLELAKFQVAGQRKLNEVPIAEDDTLYKPGFRLQAEHAVAAVRGLPNRSTTMTEALETMKLIGDIFAQSEAAAA